MYKDTLQKVKKFMTETGMLQNCSEIILGVSGGPDSMTMLHILNELRDEFDYRLRVVHVNHGIRGKEALRDQQMVEKICSEWKIPCAVYNYDVPALALSWKMGTEEAGRTGQGNCRNVADSADVFAEQTGCRESLDQPEQEI